MRFIVFARLVSLPSFARAEEKGNEPSPFWKWAGRNGTFDFLFTLGAIETRRCKRICNIESVLITKTGIKGD